MSGDGDARGLEEAAAAVAEAGRELREAAAALVATRTTEEDALGRRAVALDADVRRLQGSSTPSTPPRDKVEEELERAKAAITDSDVALFLPSKQNGKFLKMFSSPVNVCVVRKEDKLKIKDEYNNYRDRTAYKFLLFPSILLLLRWWIWDGCLPAMAVQIYQAWLLCLYTCFALRENILIVNGSDIRPWWIYHHYVAMLMALISLTWAIKGQPDCSSKQRGVQLFFAWGNHARHCDPSTEYIPATKIAYPNSSRKVGENYVVIKKKKFFGVFKWIISWILKIGTRRKDLYLSL